MFRLSHPSLRERAPQLMFYLLVSFGASVVLTRLFLWLSGYPQVGSGSLHIAHLLWGGLLLALSGVVLLIFAAPSLHPLAAVGIGVGIGLFVDEVGKFITRDNNYFFRPAAPIIYASFLVIALVYGLTRRALRQRHPRVVMIALLEMAMRFVDGPQPASRLAEFDALSAALKRANPSSDYGQLTDALHAFVHSEDVLAARRSRWMDARTAAERVAQHFFVRHARLITVMLITLLTLRGMGSLLEAGLLGMLGISPLSFLQAMVTAGAPPVSGFDAIGFVSGMFDGIVLLLGCALFIAGKRQTGLLWMQAALVLSLSVGGVFAFYSNQFSATLSMLADFGALLYLRWYRNQFVRQAEHAGAAPAVMEHAP